MAKTKSPVRAATPTKRKVIDGEVFPPILPAAMKPTNTTLAKIRAAVRESFREKPLADHD